MLFSHNLRSFFAPKMLFSHNLRSFFPRLLFCRFHDSHAATAAYHEAASLDCDDGNPCMAARSPCSWLRLMARELPLPEIRYKCRNLIARIGRCRWRPGHAATVASSEFGYDLMSYVLNFEDDRRRELDEEFPARNLSARLPVSPDRLLPAKL